MTSARRSPSGVTTVPPTTAATVPVHGRHRVTDGSRPGSAAAGSASRGGGLPPARSTATGTSSRSAISVAAGRIGQRPLPGAQLEDGQVRFPARRLAPMLPGAGRRARASTWSPGSPRPGPSQRAAASTASSPGQRRARRRCARAGRWRWCPAGIPGRWRCGRPGRRSFRRRGRRRTGRRARGPA